MTDTYLIVPINIAALAVGHPDVQGDGPQGVAENLAPMADFSRLPWVNAGQKHNPGPYTSAAALENAEAFQGQVPLPQGIHIHWALPDGLTMGKATPDGLSFPSAPNRWLVTRIVVTSPSGAAATTALRSWVVESDRQSDASTAPMGLIQPNLALQLDVAGGQNFAYLGQAFELAGWREVGSGAPRLTPFTALGYGHPTFAAFYPNCSTVFGHYDNLADLGAYDPAISTISYQVAGWYSDAAADPLAQPQATPASHGWRVADGAKPGATLCAGVIDALPWNPATPYLNGAPGPMTVAVGSSIQEAISALMANILQKNDPGQYASAEQVLNALQFGLLSGSANRIDSLAAFEEEVHAAGFRTLSAGPMWSVTQAGSAAGGGEVSLPDAWAEQLNALNVSQLQLNDAQFQLQSLQFQLFVDWYKYQLVEHDQTTPVPPVLADLRKNIQEVTAYLRNGVAAIAATQSQAASLEVQVKTLSDALTATLPSKMTLSDTNGAPRYYQPSDPVLILSGPDVTPTERYGFDGAGSVDGMLPCRTDSAVVAAVTLAAGLLPRSASVSLAAAALPQLAARPPGAPSALLQALLAETFFVSPGLQPSIAAAITALGGLDNPARLDLAGTVSALVAAAKAFLVGSAPAQVSYTGAAPAPLYYDAWQGTPWLPLLMQYSVQFEPVQYLAPGTGSAYYSPGFIGNNFAVDADTIDLRYTGALAGHGQTYTGTAILTPGATVDLANEIAGFIGHTGADAELQAVLDDLDQLPILAQGLSGATEAFLMRGLTLQMPVGDPLTPPPMAAFVQSVRAAVGKENGFAPLPEESFNPIRSGLLSIRRLRLIDVFGRFKDYDAPETVVAKGLVPPSQLAAPSGAAFLPPRLAQASRLLFRWRAANDRGVETNDSPATTPVLGWVIPNYLDNSLQIYAAGGAPLGELALSADQSTVLFTPAPGGIYPIDTAIATVFAGQNVDLANFAIGIYNGGAASFFAPFFAAVREALTFSMPQQFAQSAQQALLAGQPLALARASLALNLAGIPATEESWSGFAKVVLNKAVPSDAGVSEVAFPVVLGAVNQLGDTLVGYWIDPGTEAHYRNFYAPYATTSEGGVQAPVQDSLTLCPQATSGGQTDVVMLLDPRGAVHATTGILPVKAIDIPPSQYAAALAALELTFRVAPVLSGSNLPGADGAGQPMLMVQPKLSSGNWSWVSTNGTNWTTTALRDAATSKATLNYSPQHLSEGWLGLSKATDGNH